VLEYIQSRLPEFEWREEIPSRRCRLIRKDGLPETLRDKIREDLSTPPSKQKKRVYVLTGKQYGNEDAVEERNEIRDTLEEKYPQAPSKGARKTARLLNDRKSNIFAKTKEHLPEAYERVRQMDIEVSLSREERRTLNWRQRRMRRKRKVRKQRIEYWKVLSAIRDQHQPFYAFSRGGRTDRVFPYNKCALNLPKTGREILFQDFYEIDLRSAHLLIAAWLWDAEHALEQLTDPGFSIWDNLMEHYRPLFHENGHEVPKKGNWLYEKIKAALKVAIYSTVYGMPAPRVQAGVTRNLKGVLGPQAGAHFLRHPIIEELFIKRDKRLRNMEVGDVFEGPTGIEVLIEQGLDEDEDKVDPKSAMATLAQSYEQSLMQVLLEYEKDRNEASARNHFKVVLWIHDGAYVHFRGKGQARMEELNERLLARREQLAEFAGKETPLPAYFEKEKIEPSNPDLAESGPGVANNEKCRSAAGKETARSDRRRKARAPEPQQNRRGAGTQVRT